MTAKQLFETEPLATSHHDGTGVWVGIDPGLTGAMALLWPNEPITFVDTPTIPVTVGGKNRSEYDVCEIATLLGNWKYRAGEENRSLCVAIERQQAMPAVLHGRQQGTVSSFRVGFGFGMWLGVIQALGIPFELVAPVSWKKKLMPDMSKDKGASIIAAQRLFPDAAGDLRRKKDHARADALLIGEFARRRRSA